MIPKLKFFKPIKSTRGKYVSRSKYQKLAEENKKLLKDIKILVGDLTTGTFEVDKRELHNKWRKKFEEEKRLNELIYTLLKTKHINPK